MAPRQAQEAHPRAHPLGKWAQQRIWAPFRTYDEGERYHGHGVLHPELPFIARVRRHDVWFHKRGALGVLLHREPDLRHVYVREAQFLRRGEVVRQDIQDICLRTEVVSNARATA